MTEPAHVYDRLVREHKTIPAILRRQQLPSDPAKLTAALRRRRGRKGAK